ncbi:ATP-grasp domain-containing protein [Streptomyces sp. NPDC050856]|uniref:ATP-grasp domain-containing protein n=1 Tax=Streptomyces sp. NPDC050856 TaxID=3154939 RepID=UPI00340F15C8
MEHASHRPRLAVVYDRGAASVAEITASLSPVAPLVFVVDPEDAHTEPLLPLLRDMGEVVSLADGPDRAAARLRRAGAEGVVTFSERMLPVTAELAGRLGLEFHDRRTVERLTDKWRQRACLREAGVDSVRCRRVTALDGLPPALAEVGYPAIVKPVVSEGSRNTYRIDGGDDVPGLLARLAEADEETGFVVEEYLPGRPGGEFSDQVSVESVVQRGRVAHLGVTGKFRLLPPFRERGSFLPAVLSAPETRRVLDLAGRAVTALGVENGLTHVEIKLTPAGPRLIEVNGRLGGHLGELVLRASGQDMIRMAGLVALGEPVRAAFVSPGDVVFHFMNQAPPLPCRLVSVDGAKELRNTEGVSGYRAFVRPGASISGGVSTTDLDILFGRASSHDEMLRVLDSARARLTFTFDFPAGPAVLDTAALDATLPAGGLIGPPADNGHARRQ